MTANLEIVLSLSPSLNSWCVTVQVRLRKCLNGSFQSAIFQIPPACDVVADHMPVCPTSAAKAGAHRLMPGSSLERGEGALNSVHTDLGSKQGRTGSVVTTSVRKHNSSTEPRSAPSRTPRRIRGRDAPMGAVGHYDVTRGTGRRGEDNASFEAT
jgi:hypothetical protein